MKANHPKITIVVMTYNKSDELKKCLFSLISQDYDKDKYEIIVVDDASKDATKKSVSMIMKTSKVKIKYFRHKKNKGVAAARNTGIRNTKGEYIIFVADDYILPKDYLKTAYKIMKNSSIQVLSFRIVKKNNDFISKIFQLYRDSGIFPEIYKKNNNFFIKIPQGKYIKKTNLISASGAAIFRRRLFKSVGVFDEKFRTGEDTDFGYRLFLRGINIYHTNNIEILNKYNSGFFKTLKQVFYYGSMEYKLKNKYPEFKLVVPNNFLNVLRLIFNIFPRTFFKIRHCGSLSRAIVYAPFLFLMNTSRIMGVFYGYIKK